MLPLLFAIAVEDAALAGEPGVSLLGKVTVTQESWARKAGGAFGRACVIESGATLTLDEARGDKKVVVTYTSGGDLSRLHSCHQGDRLVVTPRFLRKQGDMVNVASYIRRLILESARSGDDLVADINGTSVVVNGNPEFSFEHGDQFKVGTTWVVTQSVQVEQLGGYAGVPFFVPSSEPGQLGSFFRPVRSDGQDCHFEPRGTVQIRAIAKTGYGPMDVMLYSPPPQTMDFFSIMNGEKTPACDQGFYHTGSDHQRLVSALTAPVPAAP